jgi:peptide/nickel transport system ATP-binding protein
MAEELLRVEDLRVEYLSPAGDVCVVDGVSFGVGAGEVFGLAGESGSGKSTIAMAVLRLLGAPAAITGGRILYRGRDVLDMDDAALRRFRWRHVSLVMQSAMNALNPVITIGEQLADVICVHELVSAGRARARAGGLLERVGIDPARLGSYPHELSGGMRQRVVIAMALALRPSLIIMDEPTTALDVVVQREILAEIARLRRELGFAILFITHDLSLMLEMCTRIGVLYAGRLVECGPASTLLGAARHPYTRGLIASFPDVRGTRGRLTGIGGTPPDLRAPPAGCRFHPRCAHSLDRCRATSPALVPAGTDHELACHLPSPPPWLETSP